MTPQSPFLPFIERQSCDSDGYLRSWKLANGYFDRQPFRYFTDAEADWYSEQERLWREGNRQLSTYQARKMFDLLPPVEAIRGGLDKDAIKERCDLVEVYKTLHPTLKVIERGRYVVAQCFMHEDSKPSLSINREKKLWYCQSNCCIGGDVISLVEKSLDETFLGSLSWLDRHC